MYIYDFSTWRFALRKPVFCGCVLAGLIAAVLPACDGNPATKKKPSTVASASGHDEHDGHNHDEHEGHNHGAEAKGPSTEMPPGTVAIPPQVRQNLGITLATVEMRRVASTIRMPGNFEALPSAVREYHAPLPGRVELLVTQYDHVSTGTPLYRLSSSEWRTMQQELLSAHAEVMAASAALLTARVVTEGGDSATDVRQQRIASSESHIRSLQQAIKVAEERVAQVKKLQGLMGGKLSEMNEAQAQVANLRSELSKAREDRAELNQQQIQLATDAGSGAFGTSETMQANLLTRQAEYRSATARRDLLLANLHAFMGVDQSETTATAESWAVMPEITVKAMAEGTVSAVAVSTGAYVDTAAAVLTTQDTKKLRFRALALQSDVQQINANLQGKILQPGTNDGSGQFIPVVVTPGLEADAEERTLDLVAEVDAIYPWAKSGLSTDLELVLDDTEDPEPAIPVEAVIQDGLDKVFFRRNPNNPDQAVRVKADLGLSDGHWVVVNSGIKAGDQVVLDGVYELKLATADAPQAAGHFHADGTFHEGED